MLRLSVGSNIVVDAIPLRRRPTDVRDLLRGSLATLRGQADAFDIGLRVEVDDNVPEISVDRTKIAWAITALVGNALRYVRHGSQTMTGGSIRVRASYAEPLREVTIAIQDDGPGMPPDRLRSLFGDRDDAPGAALGLSMVREVVTAHGGIVQIESDTEGLSRGTTVRLTLPVGA